MINARVEVFDTTAFYFLAECFAFWGFRMLVRYFFIATCAGDGYSTIARNAQSLTWNDNDFMIKVC